MIYRDFAYHETPFKLDCKKILEKYGKNYGKDISNIYGPMLYDENEKKLSINSSHTKEQSTVKFDLNNDKFYNDYVYFWADIFKKCNLPKRSKVHCSIKRLKPKSHGVHSDSDNSYATNHNCDVFYRFLLPLTEGSPTIYFNECMPDDSFYVRVDKNKFATVKDNRWTEIQVDKLYREDNFVEITDDVCKIDNGSHLLDSQLCGLTLYKIQEWEVGTIQLFPCSCLHTSSDFEDFDYKWFMTGIIYQ